MKTKRFLSLLLAMVMSFSMAVPVFAAEPDDPDEGIMPLMNIYENPTVNEQSTGRYETHRFTSTPGYGKYIKVWYANRTQYDATVKLYVVGQSGFVEKKLVKAYDYKDDNVIWYEIPDTAPVTFYVIVEGKNGYPVVGHLSVLQTDEKPA